MVAPSAPRDAKSKIPPGPEGSNGIDGRVRRDPSAGPAAILAPAHAAMSLDRTRVIITAQEREASVNVRSEDTSPILLQVWVDGEMDPDASTPNPQDTPIPFIADPPMFRIDPELSRQVRILLVQPPDSMPGRHESLFWLNLHETPVRPSGKDGENYIQLAFHVRIKLFYRPAALNNYTLTDAHKLRFALSRNDQGEPVLEIHNPAPIHQSMATLELVHGDERIEFDAPMLTPEGRTQLPLDSLPASSGLKVAYSTIDDNGARVEGEQAL